MAAVLVGGISFDVIEGLPQTALSSQQIFDLYKNSFTVGLKEPEIAQDGKAEIVTRARVASEAACAAKANLCRAIVGVTLATVQLDTGITVDNQFIETVECEWKVVRGFTGGNSYLFTAKWSLFPCERNPTVSLAEVWTAQKWGKWKQQTQIFCFEASEGLGTYAGECELIQKIGTVDSDPAFQADIMGQWVEIRAKESPNSPRTVPIWWGVVTKKTVARIPSGAEARFVCSGLAEVLRQAVFYKWYEQYYGIDGVTAKTCDPGSVLPFNDVLIGNKTAADNQIIGTALTRQTLNVPMHNRTLVPHNKFTATEAMTMAVAALNDQYPYGPIWRLTGQTTALDYFLSEDLEYHTVLDVVRALASPSRGMTFGLQVPLTSDASNNNAAKSDVYANINISTGLAQTFGISADESVPELTTVTFPAAEKQLDADFTQPNITHWSYDADYSEVYDVLYIQGERRIGITSIGYKDSEQSSDTVGTNSQLTKDWTSAEETAWDAANSDDREAAGLCHVWRRFKLKPFFSGKCYGQTANLGFKRTVRTDGSETGEYEIDETNFPAVAGSAWKLLRHLPVPDKGHWANLSGTQSSIDFRAVSSRPFLFFDDGGSFENWSLDYDVAIGDDSATIEIGRTPSDGADIKSKLVTHSKKMVLTIAYEFPIPWRISWRRASVTVDNHFSSSLPNFQPKDMPRVLMLHAKGDNYRWRTIDKGAIEGLVGHTPTKVSADVTLWKPGSIYQLLELAKLRYTNPRVRAGWTKAGEIDLNKIYCTQTLIKSTTIPFQDRQDQSGVPVYGVLTRRKWDFRVGRQSMTYSVEPSLPELNAMGIAEVGFGASEGF